MGKLDDQLNTGRKQGRKKADFKGVTYESAADQHEALVGKRHAKQGTLFKRDKAIAGYEDAGRNALVAQRNHTKLQEDFKAIQEQRPEDVRNWQEIARTTIRLGETDDPEAKETSLALMHAYGDYIREHVDAEDNKWWEENWQEPEDTRNILQKGLGVAAPLFDYLDQWGQSALSGIAGLEAAIDTDDEVSAGEGIAHAIRQGARAIDVTRAVPKFDGISQYLENVESPSVITKEDGTRLSFDRDQDGSINLREALGKDPEAGGRGLGAIDLIGTILVDPTTYVTLGSSGMAKAGMAAAEEAAERLAKEGLEGASRASARAINQQIREQGWKALSDVDQRLYEGYLRTASEMAAEAGGRTTTRLGRDMVEAQLSAVQRGGRSGLRVAGTTTLPTGRAGTAARTGTSAVGQTLFKGNGILPRALSALKPRARISALYGSAVARDFGHLLSVTREPEQLADITTRLGTDLQRSGSLRRALDEVGDEAEWGRQIDAALSNPASFETIIREAGPEMQQLLTTLDDVRTETFAATLRGQGYTPSQIDDMAHGLMDLPDNMRDINTYIPRVIAGAVRSDSGFMQQIKNLGGEAGTLASRSDSDALAERFLQARDIAPNTDSVVKANEEINAALRTAGLDAPEAFFETNIPAAMAVRARSAFEAAAEVDLLDGLTELDFDDGLALAFRAEPDEALTLSADKIAQGLIREAGGQVADFRPVTLANGTVYRVHKDIAAELENVRRVFGDPKEISNIGRLFDKANNVWAMSATISMINPAFHMRNALGNIALMGLGGVRNPQVMVDAVSLMRKNGEIERAMRATGATYEAAARSLDIDPKQLAQLQGARSTGVLGDSRTLDLTRERAGTANAPTKPGLLQRINPASDQSIINKPGIAIGQSVEGQARLALYLDQLNKGVPSGAASQHVKRYLFDYGDLTRFEGEQLRRISRFYTFTRKNLGVQLAALAQYPGRVANVEEITQGLVGLTLGDLDPDKGGAESGAPDWMRNAILGSLGGDNVAVSVDTPLASAAEFAELGTAVKDLFTEKGPLEDDNSKAELISKIDGLFSGVGVSALDWWQETQTGQDSFTGRPLGDELRDHWLFRGVDTFFPGASRLERYGAQTGVTRGGEDARSVGVILANTIFGLQTQPLTEDTDASARYVLYRQVEETMDELRDAGVDVPTIDELREQGEIRVKDRVLHAMLYSWEQDENGELVWSEQVRDDRLLNTIPKDVREALGLPEPTSGTGSSRGARPDRLDADQFDLQQALEAIEAYRGQVLTEEEKMQIILASPWAPNNSLLEGMGIEPFRDSNRFIEGEEGPSYEDQLKEAEQELDALASTAGLSQSAFTQMRPRLSDFQRVLHEAEAAGVEGQELQDYIIKAKDEGGGGVLSRADRAAINQLLGYGPTDGPVELSTTREVTFSEEDARKTREQAWQAEQEYLLFSQLYGLPRPTPQQVQDYVVNAVMTKGDQRSIGLDPLRGAPNREDIRSDAQKREDARNEFVAARSGLSGRRSG